jgi:hypothetical protein
MMLTPEKKWEIEVEIAKFLRHLMAEEKERCDTIDVIDIKKFDLNMHPQKVSVSPR